MHKTIRSRYFSVVHTRLSLVQLISMFPSSFNVPFTASPSLRHLFQMLLMFNHPFECLLSLLQKQWKLSLAKNSLRPLPPVRLHCNAKMFSFVPPFTWVTASSTFSIRPLHPCVRIWRTVTKKHTLSDSLSHGDLNRQFLLEIFSCTLITHLVWPFLRTTGDWMQPRSSILDSVELFISAWTRFFWPLCRSHAH